jgi:hypothetical protein
MPEIEREQTSLKDQDQTRFKSYPLLFVSLFLARTGKTLAARRRVAL